ncbi:helix-turn-helix domain-containing protein [Burkholderia gladioli]|uniref:helix-turn-helix domain-containing protein n=1 Tax=Burkholderia gladioli TaxID=28095 RepID=UPI00163FA486|nr:helix-turn-helix domain-containing protein [Burkholderia gladioli]
MQNTQSFLCILNSWPENTAAHQRARLLETMRVRGGVTTLEAMRFLDIVDPRARIVELRKGGYDIRTSWTHQPSECGRLHTVGLYTLSSLDNGVAVTMASKTSNNTAPQQMKLALWSL